ncbi:MAG: TolB protein [Phycisphaerales bacterium]|jgi:Tol biopolymer transport system component|nr:TolB protein [Phycisphaerales bacterium]
MQVFIRSLKIIKFLVVLSLLSAGCVTQRPASEADVLFDVTQLTHDFARAGEAYFAPNFRWIVFQATPKGEQNYQMYVAPLISQWEPYPANTLNRTPRVTGIGTPVRISPMPSKNTCGFFSPDGNSLIFASTAGKEFSTTQPATSAPGYQRSTGTYRWEFPPEMEIFRVDRWEPAILAAAEKGQTNFARHPLTNNAAYDAECAFSPDSNWIIFTSLRTGDAELFVMRADGSNVVQLTHTKGYDGGPFFSPDGKRVVYRSDRAGNDLLQIFTADVVRDRSGNITGLRRERQLTRDRNVNWGPYWHPDGKHIIYATSAHGHQNYELYLMRRDGSRKTRITCTEGFDGLPAFSPDGRQLMWSSKRTKDGTTQVFIAQFLMPTGS